MAIKRLLTVGILACLGLVQPALAYIDPGTGATIIGNLWPLLVAIVSGFIAFLAKKFWHPIKNKLTRKK